LFTRLDTGSGFIEVRSPARLISHLSVPARQFLFMDASGISTAAAGWQSCHERDLSIGYPSW
jgi:hypothetical protein